MKHYILVSYIPNSDINECDLDPCPQNYTCNNTLGSFECLFCNASSDNCTTGINVKLFHKTVTVSSINTFSFIK